MGGRIRRGRRRGGERAVCYCCCYWRALFWPDPIKPDASPVPEVSTELGALETGAP
jgi:hypothetical protein